MVRQRVSEPKDLLYSALNNLIDAAKIIRENQEGNYLCSRKQWLKEFCTIRLQSVRRSGHNSCIELFLKEHITEKCMVLHTVCEQNKYFKSNCHNLNISNCYFSTTHCLMNCRGLSKIDYIIVNNASTMLKKDLNNIYDFALTSNISRDFLIILIG